MIPFGFLYLESWKIRYKINIWILLINKLFIYMIFPDMKENIYL